MFGLLGVWRLGGLGDVGFYLLPQLPAMLGCFFVLWSLDEEDSGRGLQGFYVESTVSFGVFKFEACRV